jgi:hypothetical protein
MQMFARIAKLVHLVGLRITWGFLYGAYFCYTAYACVLNICSMNCASIHRKMGTHISKVYVLPTQHNILSSNGLFTRRKSITMDTWHKEQVEVSFSFLLSGPQLTSAHRKGHEAEWEPEVKRLL